MTRKKPQNSSPRLDGLNRPQRRDLRTPKPISNEPRAQRRRHSTRKPRSDDLRQAMVDIDQDQQKPKKRRGVFSSTSILRRAGLTAMAILIIGGSFLGFKLVNTVKSAIVDRGQNALGLQGDIKPGELNGEGDGRVNILLIGIGGKNHPGGELNDVTMVVSIDPTNNEVAMLSIPRDLYLAIPGHYSTRINSTYFLGEQSDSTTGEELTAEVVEEVLDINIHYYARIDFQGFVKVIDEIGGVTVDAPERIYDPYIETAFGTNNYRQAFVVEEGEQKMDGATALQYARSRKTTSDFDRSRRQQIILQAVKDKVLSAGTYSNPVKISGVLDAIKNHFRTDISISAGLRMLEIAQNINSNSVRTAVLDTSADNYLTGRNINGASVLVPKAGLNDFSEIQNFVKGDLFADGFLKKENASITVLNGTTVPGLATTAANELSGLGYNVEAIDNAPQQDQTSTKIYDTTGGIAPYTLELLSKRLIQPPSVNPPDSLSSGFPTDIIIVLGQDYANRQ